MKLRTMLAAEIKSGMIERKNREESIVVLAALVRFTRLEQDRRDQIIAARG